MQLRQKTFTGTKAAPFDLDHLPAPPDDTEKYSYFQPRTGVRWPFVWLFIGQLGTAFGFTMVMRKSPDTALGLIFLTFIIPPMCVNLWLRVRRHRLSEADHRQRVDLWEIENYQLPSVDVFLPSCGEDVATIENTLACIANLRWAGSLEVHVLDDAGSSPVKALARKYGFNYIARDGNEWKKASNLINAFDQTRGEFIVVFDADFATRTDFLYETMPYMDDPATGVVQTAQYFDVDQPRVSYIARYAGALQELFFRWIQPARDTYEAAICAGTNVVYRRAAVEAAGGFARVPLGEDVHSGVKIWVAHYRTRYVPLVVAKGLAPRTFAEVTWQQYRWCRSSMLIMVSDFFKDAPFSRRQRTCFWAAFLYYMASATILVTSALPTTFMVWIFPREFHWWNYLVLIPAFVSTFVVFPRLARGWDIRIYRVTIMNSCCHLLAVFDALAQRVQAWVPTGAAGRAVQTSSRKADIPLRVQWIIRIWFTVVQSLLWVGLVRDLRLGSTTLPVVLPAIALAALQIYMVVPLLWRPDARMRDKLRPPQLDSHAVRQGNQAPELAAETVGANL